jgi:Cu(I)/Ag(I) efflux system membrane fusion protein
MFVSMQFMDTRAHNVLLIPTEAVIQTGKRTVVMVAEENGKFKPVEVQAGIESGGQTEILGAACRLARRWSSRPQFLIDSEASLKGVEARLNDAPKPTAANTAPRHDGEAKVEAIGPDTFTLSHGPIPSLKWGDDHGLQASAAQRAAAQSGSRRPDQ